jgi:hypothetical protein
MKYLLPSILFLFIFSCAGVQKEKVKAPDLKGLTGFFTTFENDMKNSTSTIAKQDLIKSLTHLLRMASGGTKYYPLERDALTKMINELASYQYSECILLNKNGVIIYSMYEDDMLSKKADYYPKSIGIIHNNIKDSDGFILDDLAILGKEGKKALLFGMNINTAEGFQGILVAGIEIEKIIEYAEIKETVVNSAGIIMMDSSVDNLSKQFSEVPGISAKTKKETFSYRNIFWDIYQ